MTQQTSDWSVVMERLEKLEKQNRRLKQAGAVALVVVASILFMGQAARNKTIEANEFILRDTSGIIRGRWSPQAFVILDAKGESGAMLNTTQGPALTLLDAKGKARAALALTAGGPELSLQGVNGKTIASLFAHGNEPQLELSDGNGRKRAALSVVLESPVLSLLDDAGETRAALAVTPDGPTLDLLDRNGKERALIGIDSTDGFPKIVLQDASAKPLASLMETRDGTQLVITDEKGFWTAIGTTDMFTPRTGETHRTSAASVVLFDKDKKVLWQAP